jgi:Uma2 family endonuclease
MAQTKPAGAWTYEDLFALPDDGKRYEIIEGELYEIPSPTSAHAITIMNLIALLLPIVGKLGGRLITAPLDVFFPGADPVQPDILVILPDGEARIERRGIEGAPDLVVEVISPSKRGHDLLLKRALYGRAGVREYWLLDPETRTIEILTLAGDALQHAVAASGEDRPISPLLGPLSTTADQLFAGIDF